MTSTLPGQKVPEVSGIAQAGFVLEDRYELKERVGKGGMGVVMKAQDLRMDRSVAVKLVHSHLASNNEFIQRFEREVVIAKELNHQNTIRLYDYGVHENMMYLVMEYLEGQELQEIINEGPMAVERVLRLSRQMLDGLAEAHAIDVVHRDLKPGNIFICEDRRGRELVKILDFGIAKSLGDAQQGITKTGQVVGTAPYLPPELYMSSDVTKACDVYSCGLIMLEMLCARRVIDVNSLVEAMSQHIHMPIVVPDSLANSPLKEVIERATAKDPQQRYPDAEAMLAELQSFNGRLSTAPLQATEIAQAFDQMNAGYAQHTQNMLSGTGPQKVEEPSTLLLDETELQDLSTQSMPASATAETISDISHGYALGGPEKPETDTAIEEPDGPTIARPGEYATQVHPWSSFTNPKVLVAGGLVAVALIIGVAALIFSGAPEEASPTTETPQEASPETQPHEETAQQAAPAVEPEVIEAPGAHDDENDDEEQGDEEQNEPEEDQPPSDTPSDREEEPAQEDPSPTQPPAEPRPTTPPPSEPRPRPPADDEPSQDSDDDSGGDPFDSVLDRHL